MTSGREVRVGRKLHSVIDKVYNLANLREASRKVCSNKGAPGIDGLTVKSWKADEDRKLSGLRRLMLEDRYRSKPVKRSYIPKPGSRKKRPLGIPIIRDRVAQQAVAQKLIPAFEEIFFEGSHGFRPGRSTHTAARRIEQLRREGYRYVVDLDVEAFFDRVDHEQLIRLVRQVVKDRRVLGLIRGWLKAGVMEEGKIRYQTSGTPQGGPISPLLSNVYLTPFDYGLEKAGYRHIRYADDVLILCRSREEAQRALEVARRLLGKLKLTLNEEKTKVSTFGEGFDFLGFHFGSHGRGVGRKSLKGFYQKVRATTRRHQGDRPVEAVIESLNPILRGWAQYHRHGRNRTLFRHLDKWVRNRVRAYVRRRWRDRGRWKIYTAEQLGAKGLFSLHFYISEGGQLRLF